jgi:hypothetical protein
MKEGGVGGFLLLSTALLQNILAVTWLNPGRPKFRLPLQVEWSIKDLSPLECR